MTEPGARIRVVIMDDHDDVLTLLRISAEMDGRFEVVGTASEGAEAIELAGRLKPDVVILDHLVDAGPRRDTDDAAGMSGVDAVDHLRALLPGVFIAMYSGYPREAGAPDGADLYLVKGDVDPAALMASIASAVQLTD